jgi:hypothetical protein
LRPRPGPTNALMPGPRHIFQRRPHMIVRDLIAKLQEYDGDASVELEIDVEGAGHCTALAFRIYTTPTPILGTSVTIASIEQ